MGRPGGGVVHAASDTPPTAADVTHALDASVLLAGEADPVLDDIGLVVQWPHRDMDGIPVAEALLPTVRPGGAHALVVGDDQASSELVAALVFASATAPELVDTVDVADGLVVSRLVSTFPTGGFATVLGAAGTQRLNDLIGGRG